MILAETLSESEATRRIFLTAGALGLLGLLLLIATVWWWRSTRSDHPALARLEVLSTRRWAKASEPERARMLAKARPASAEAEPELPPDPEPVDLSILAAGDHAGFDDLREIDLMLGLHLPGALGSSGTAPATSVASSGPDQSLAAATPVPDPDGGARSTEVLASDGVDPSAVAADAPSSAARAEVGVPRADAERVVSGTGHGSPVEPAEPIATSVDPGTPDEVRGAGIDTGAADRPTSSAGERVLAPGAIAVEGVAGLDRGTVSTIAAPEGAARADALRRHDGVSDDVLADEDATSAIGAEVIDPLLQRATNPD